MTIITTIKKVRHRLERLETLLSACATTAPSTPPSPEPPPPHRYVPPASSGFTRPHVNQWAELDKAHAEITRLLKEVSKHERNHKALTEASETLRLRYQQLRKDMSGMLGMVTVPDNGALVLELQRRLAAKSPPLPKCANCNLGSTLHTCERCWNRHVHNASETERFRKMLRTTEDRVQKLSDKIRDAKDALSVPDRLMLASDRCARAFDILRRE